MATFNIEYGKIKLDSSRMVYFRLCINSTSKRIPTPYVLKKNEYKVYADGRVRITNDEKYFEVQDMYNDLNAKLLAYLREEPFTKLDAERLFMVISRKSANSVMESDLFEWVRGWLADTKPKDAKNYKSTINSIVRFTGRQTFMFCELDYMFLKRYSAWLKDKPRALTLYLGCIRHLYKEACLEFNTEREAALSPMLFERFKIPRQKPVGQRALELDEVRKVFAYQPTMKRDELARDVVILSFCLMGTNSVDLFAAKEVKEGVICYDRAKTKDRRYDNAHIEIDIHPVIQPIIDKYKSSTGKRVFNFSEKYSCPSQFNKNVNIGLKIIGEALGIERLQFYQFRHSWASIARNELDIDAYTVDKALNHVSRDLSMLDVYVKKSYKAINEANRKVIDFVFNVG